MEPAGNFVRSLVELAAGVELGEHDFGSGNFFGGMNVDRNSSAVVDDRNAVIDVNGDFDRVAMAHKGFINRVINNFVYQMMQAAFGGIADIHPWAFSNRLKPFQDFDVIGTVDRILWVFLFGHFLSLPSRIFPM